MKCGVEGVHGITSYGMHRCLSRSSTLGIHTFVSCIAGQGCPVAVVWCVKPFDVPNMGTFGRALMLPWQEAPEASGIIAIVGGSAIGDNAEPRLGSQGLAGPWSTRQERRRLCRQCRL